MASVIAFRHFASEHLGLITHELDTRAIGYEYCDLDRGDAVPDLRDVSGLMFLGGQMSANDDLPFIRRELALIAQAVAIGTPLLGVCLGAQLIAKALGARVYPAHEKEIGWYPSTGQAPARASLASA